jgi:ubiquitin carboxyl-terminal hydrolase 6/32
LKRFNYVNNKWVKSQKVVNFPFDDFDPTPYLASVPQETILRHREVSADTSRCLNIDDEITEFDRENSPVPPHLTNGHLTNGDILPIDERHQNGGDDGEAGDDTMNEDDNTAPVKSKLQEKNMRNSSNVNAKKLSVNHNNNNNNNVDKKGTSQRQRLVSTSLTKTPVIDGEFIDYHNHKLKPNEDKFDLKYKLYAVVVSFSEGKSEK